VAKNISVAAGHSFFLQLGVCNSALLISSGMQGKIMYEVSDQSIKKFVCAELGCQCPEQVFDKIRVENTYSDFVSIFDRELLQSSWLINVGARLLILVLNVKQIDFGKSKVESLINRGRMLRDQGNFNRFRLVVATDNPVEGGNELSQQFDKLVDEGENLHLHILSLDKVPDELL